MPEVHVRRPFDEADLCDEHGSQPPEDMMRIVREQRLGYIATVCPDGIFICFDVSLKYGSE